MEDKTKEEKHKIIREIAVNSKFMSLFSEPCISCQQVYKPDNIASIGMLRDFEGHTVNVRLAMFHKIEEGKPGKAIGFYSEGGLLLLAKMHQGAQEIGLLKMPKDYLLFLRRKLERMIEAQMYQKDSEYEVGMMAQIWMLLDSIV